MNGTNTQIVVRFPEITDITISCEPRTAAIFGFAPLLRYEYILSIITIDASTIIPTPRISPVIVIMLSVSPAKFIASSVMMMERGMEIAIIIVDLKF